MFRRITVNAEAPEIRREDQNGCSLLGGRTVDSGETLAGNSPSPFYHLAGNDKFFDAFLRRKGVHGIKKQFFQDHHQAAGADFPLDCLSGDGLECVLGELQLDVVEVELLLVLLDQRVLGFGKYFDECSLVEFVQNAAYGQTSDKLRDQSEANEIFRLHLRERLG